MPQLITHNLFAKDVYKKLDKEIQESIKDSIDVYEMFSQSFDTFMYTISLNPNFIKQTTSLRKRGHKKNVNKYFTNMINNIKELNLENNSQVLGYIFGSINHYILDSTAHPFIFYKTGLFDYKKRKETSKYIGLHGDMETQIDAFYYTNRYKKLYNKVNVTKEFIPKIKFSKELTDIVNKTIEETYGDKNMAKVYFRAYNNSRMLYRLFINDKHGIKKAIYKIFDKIIWFRKTNIEYYTTYVKSPNIKYLNIEHKKWCYPSNKNIISTDSFIDLYEKAVDKAVENISIAYNSLKNNRSTKDFSKNIGNLSYIRGLDCDNSKSMTNFEF